mmetsp:Transcript_22157/g.61664  ORF Transcript_22157/g.61664 Transcript_22157/m.61664 type:complete len:215 (+) Transcript_22157:1940-2584(+)
MAWSFVCGMFTASVGTTFLVFVLLVVVVTIFVLLFVGGRSHAARDIVPIGGLALHVQPAVRWEAKDDGEVQEDDGDEGDSGCEVHCGHVGDIEDGEHGGVDHAGHADGDQDFLHGCQEVGLGVSTLLLKCDEDDVHVVDSQTQHDERQRPPDGDVDLDAAHETESHGSEKCQDDQGDADGRDQDPGFDQVAIQKEEGGEQSQKHDGDGDEGAVV